MSYGLQVYSSTGELQLDTTQPYTTYKCIKEGVVSYNSPTTDGSGISITSQDLLLINYGGTQDTTIVASRYNNDNTWSFAGVTTMPSINYKIFRRMSSDSASTSGDYGLLCFNSDNSVAFDSNRFTNTAVIKNTLYFAGVALRGPLSFTPGATLDINGVITNQTWVCANASFTSGSPNTAYIANGFQWFPSQNLIQSKTASFGFGSGWEYYSGFTDVLYGVIY